MLHANEIRPEVCGRVACQLCENCELGKVPGKRRKTNGYNPTSRINFRFANALKRGKRLEWQY